MQKVCMNVINNSIQHHAVYQTQLKMLKNNEKYKKIEPKINKT